VWSEERALQAQPTLVPEEREQPAARPPANWAGSARSAAERVVLADAPALKLKVRRLPEEWPASPQAERLAALAALLPGEPRFAG